MYSVKLTVLSLLTIRNGMPLLTKLLWKDTVTNECSYLPDLVTTSSCTDEEPEPTLCPEPQNTYNKHEFETQPGQ